MKINYVYLLTFYLLIPKIVLGSGFHLPYQSVAAMGLADAHIAYTPGPDSSYYNPANMSYLSDSWKMDVSLTTLYLASTEYTDNRSPLLDGSSESELFFLPRIHITSKEFKNFRFGFSLTEPFGLAKRWRQPFPAATAEKYELFTIEGNPTISYLVSGRLSIGGGIRILYGDGEIKTSLGDSTLFPISPLTSLMSKVSGDDIQVGYNLALTFRPIDNLNFAATYRSKIDLNLEGNASLQALAGSTPLIDYKGDGSLKLPLPAILSLASSYSFRDITIEFTWNRYFWSSIEQFDLEFDQSFIGTPFDGVDGPIPKNWKDTDTFRFGITYEANSILKATIGFAYDNNPVPESTLGFEMPDSNTLTYTAGLQYNHTDNLILAISYAYLYYSSRAVSNDGFAGLPGINGVFQDGDAHAVTVGVIYEF